MIAETTRQVSARRLAQEIQAIEDKIGLARRLGLSPQHVYKTANDPRAHHVAFRRVAKGLGWEPDPTAEGYFRRVA